MALPKEEVGLVAALSAEVELPTGAAQVAFESLKLSAAIAVAVHVFVVEARARVLAETLLLAALGQSPGAFRIRDT